MRQLDISGSIDAATSATLRSSTLTPSPTDISRSCYGHLTVVYRLQRYHQARIRPLAAANPGVGDDRRADRMADMSPRPRHTIKEIEKLLRSLESQGWRVEKGRKYFKAYCPCGLHKRTVHLTPSTASYLRNLVGWLGRETCWEEGRP